MKLIDLPNGVPTATRARARGTVMNHCIPAVAIGLLMLFQSISAAEVKIDTVDSPPCQFAAAEIRRAMEVHRPAGDWRITFERVSDGAASESQRESFRISSSSGRNEGEITISSAADAGLLYGGLEVAEIIRVSGIEGVKNQSQTPYMAMRGTKFNIPLDVRTPSYTDVCDAAQMNIPEMWNFEFWTEYIDTLARYRYNYVSLWNLHPFPSLVKVPKYPEVALNDVWRSKVKWKEDYSLQGRDFVTEEILRDVEVVQPLTIDQKIDFWRSVMAYGKTRNVDFYFVTWNIFTNGTGGKYGITDDFRNETTIDYFRRSVKQMFLTYPDLAGIGLTTGENMPGAGFQEKEDWAMATYGQGVMDAAAEQPDRKIVFIHRQHQAKADEIAKTFRPLVEHPNVDFIFSFKYAKAHVYSATEQPYHQQFVDDLGDLETIWTLRNDDVFYFRWGGPDFVRQFVKNIPYDVSRGYYYGSDQYVWGREFLQRNVSGEREIEIDKHWYQWMLWGRFAYDPNLDNERLTGIIADRFQIPSDEAGVLFNAWQNASMVYPITTGFHWGALDFQWYIEGCQSRPPQANNDSGFHDVNRFITLEPHAKSNCQSIPDYAKSPNKPDARGRLSPPQVADSLDRHADRSLELLQQLSAPENVELERTIADIRTVAALGNYYADKIRGATQLAVYRATKDTEKQTRAIAHLVDAARHWHDYARQALTGHKNPLWTNRVGYVDWKENYLLALQDIRIAGGGAPGEYGLPARVDTEAEPIVRYPASDSAAAVRSASSTD
jgi:hypothetical protein